MPLYSKTQLTNQFSNFKTKVGSNIANDVKNAAVKDGRKISSDADLKRFAVNALARKSDRQRDELTRRVWRLNAEERKRINDVITGGEMAKKIAEMKRLEARKRANLLADRARNALSDINRGNISAGRVTQGVYGGLSAKREGSHADIKKTALRNIEDSRTQDQLGLAKSGLERQKYKTTAQGEEVSVADFTGGHSAKVYNFGAAKNNSDPSVVPKSEATGLTGGLNRPGVNRPSAGRMGRVGPSRQFGIGLTNLLKK